MHRSDTFCCDEVNIVNAGEGAPASRNRRVATATSLGLVLTATAAYWYWAQGPIPASARPPARAAVPVSIAVADRQDVPVYLIGLGTVQASFTIGIHSQVDGKLQEVLFTEGQQVKKGDVLAKIDPRLFQAALDQAKAKKA
jgi:membrane fusion protein, multidrug efflux system